jgi:hypothetical protein
MRGQLGQIQRLVLSGSQRPILVSIRWQGNRYLVGRYCNSGEPRKGEDKTLLVCGALVTGLKVAHVPLIADRVWCQKVEDMVDEGICAIHHKCEPQVPHCILTDRHHATSTGKSDRRPEVDGKHAFHSWNNREEMLKKVTGISLQ